MAMLNPYKLKRTFHTILSISITSILTYCGLIFFGFLGGIGAMLVSMIVLVPLGWLMTKNPYTPVVEGEGVLAIDLNSTGTMQPFILQVNSPKITGRIKDKEIQAYFERDIVSQLSDPIDAKKSRVIKLDNGDIGIYLSNEDYQRARFSLSGKPTFFFNSKTKTFYTKENIQNMENSTLSLHSMLLFMIEQGENIINGLKPFERNVISMLNQKGKGFNIGIIIIVIIVIIVAVFFGPKIIQILQGMMKK